ncbi:dTDP-4-dehydrorhamnose reductase [Legionella clemsonensis]|uniref:dTDP-4-dehydrorhamnose reductase n=1 Tax=Legionella clemsonensis TaxID=1867846 RepID=A0A222P3M8_9GAMM|nr:dTDP-4-dehydrorhamnose reductase [Legionella clemsonensis]ASQ46432.1 dTDP-4-dehydrorhamnose reductase [Legionella clemsonensis]
MKILLLGSTGQVGIELMAQLANSTHKVLPVSRKECDLSKPDSVKGILSQFNVDLVINAAAYTAVDMAEEENHLAYQINGFSVGAIASYCQSQNIPLIHFSTDYVFDGTKAEGYVEDDLTSPINTYGNSKLLGEQLIQATLGKYLIFRISWVFSKNSQNFVRTILRLAATREEIKIVADQWGCPTAAKDIARVIVTIIDKLSCDTFQDWGIYHYASFDPTNWYEFANSFLKLAKNKGHHFLLSRLIPIDTGGYPTKAKRPQNSVLITDKIERVFNISRGFWADYLPEVIEEFANQEAKET